MKVGELLAKYNITFDKVTGWVGSEDDIVFCDIDDKNNNIRSRKSERMLLYNNRDQDVVSYYMNGPICVFTFVNCKSRLMSFRINRVGCHWLDVIDRMRDVSELLENARNLKKFEFRDEFSNDAVLNAYIVTDKLKCDGWID